MYAQLHLTTVITSVFQFDSLSEVIASLSQICSALAVWGFGTEPPPFLPAVLCEGTCRPHFYRVHNCLDNLCENNGQIGKFQTISP